MSKDIWHKPSETTDVDNNLIIDDWINRTYELGYFDDNDMIFRNFRNDDTYFEESMMRWCDVNDLVHDYNCIRKALEIAVDLLKLIYQGNGDPQDIMRYKDNRWTSVRRLCKQTLEQITTLE